MHLRSYSSGGTTKFLTWTWTWTWTWWRHEYDIIKTRDVIDDVTNRCGVGTFIMGPYGHEPLNRLVSEIFSVKLADTQTDKPVADLARVL